MNDDDPWASAIEWLNRASGYASGFHWKNKSEKSLVERIIAQEWCRSVQQSFGAQIGSVVTVEDDPPDFEIQVNGQRKSVEVTLLVSQEGLERAFKRESPFCGKLFSDTQWDARRFKEKVASVLMKKGDAYRKRGLKVDILVIMCVEPWVSPEVAAKWLNVFDPPRPESIASAFVLFDYQPGGPSDEWPLVHLYGDCDGGLP